MGASCDEFNAVQLEAMRATMRAARLCVAQRWWQGRSSRAVGSRPKRSEMSPTVGGANPILALHSGTNSGGEWDFWKADQP